jgi:hypothetical protein
MNFSTNLIRKWRNQMPTKEQIEAIVVELQRIMRICDWDVKLEIVNSREMDATVKASYIPEGYCQKERYYKRATIFLLENMEIDWYFVLIHELYHIVQEDLSNCMDNIVYPMIADEDIRQKVEKQFDFYYEQLDCLTTRIIIGLYPVTNFKHILEA